MTVRFTTNAREDLREAKAWYRKHSPRAKGEFVATVRKTVELLQERAEAGTPYLWSIRKFVLDRFPYTIFYDVPPGAQIVIVAVWHQARDPDYWLDRIPDERRHRP